MEFQVFHSNCRMESAELLPPAVVLPISADQDFQIQVDAQLLDEANHVCQMSSSTSGMGNLLGIQAAVWMLVTQNFNDMEFANGVVKVKHSEVTAKIADRGTLRKYLKEGLTDAVHTMAGFRGGASENEKVLFPKTLEKFCERELPHWLDSAIDANLKKKDFEYVVDDDNIVIVDSARSGTLNRGSRWSYGLHQFLEMKHATNLSPENLIMCYLSTMSFFQRYKTRVIGLTGTVGGAASRKFLHEVYNVDFVEIPSFMIWRHIILPHVFCDNVHEWLETVVDKTVSKLNDGRACLVITQYIHFANQIARRIRSRSSGRVICLTGQGRGDTLGKVTAGTVIVATNVAGRGTDFKISQEVENAGGLHVLLTSLPENDRVERQNIGRSSRCGERGTSQMVLNVEHVDGYFLREMVKRVGQGASHTTCIDTLREVRDKWTLQCVDGWISDMTTSKKVDKALTKFIAMRNDVVDRFKHIKKPGNDSDKSIIQLHIQSALNFRFGVYMAKKHSSLDPDQVEDDFGDLRWIRGKNDIVKCFSDYVYPVHSAYALDWKPRKNPEEFDLALNLLRRAIELDPLFAGAAYYKRASMFLFHYINFETVSYIYKAIDDLKKSREVLQRLLDQYHLVLVATKRKDEAKTKLGAQTERLMALCGFIVSNIEVMIGRDVDKELKRSREILKDMEGKGEDVTELKQTIQELEENRETLEKGVLRDVAENESEMNLKWYSLKDMLPKNMDPEEFQDEISRYVNEGYTHLITAKKKNQINWWNVVAVAFLGLLQIAGGSLLTIFSAGAAADFGISIAVGGCFDIYRAIKSGIIDRDFNWKQYGKEKLLDLVVSLLVAGFCGLKNAALGVAAGAKTVVSVGTTGAAKEALKFAAKCAAKAATIAATKITVNEVIHATVAGPARQLVADLLTEGITKVLSDFLSNKTKLRHIVDVDLQNGNRKHSSEFVSKATKNFLNKFSPEFLEQLSESIGDGLKGNLGINPLLKTTISTAQVAIVVAKVAAHVDSLPEILNSVAANANYEHVDRHEDRAYAGNEGLSVDSVIRSLAANISDFCAAKAVSKTINFFSSKVSNLVVNTGFKKTEQQIAHFQKAFVFSEGVAQRARSAIRESNKEDAAVLKTIAEIAENGEQPGDRLQAEYSAEIVGAPIEIEYKDANGNIKLIVYGKEFSKNAPIRLKFEQGVSGQPGHYSFADGTHAKQSGKNTCLFDAVAQVTKYKPNELKRAVANFMLNDFERVKDMYEMMSDADLLVGGLRQRGPAYSTSAVKHVASVETVNDVLKKANATQAARKRKVPVNTVVDHDLEDFDTRADAAYDEWISKNSDAKPTGVQKNVQYTYLFDESNIYETKHVKGEATERKVPVNTVVDHDLEDFDTRADAAYDEWISKNSDAKPTGVQKNVQYTYLFDESNIYETKHVKGEATEICAYRAKPVFMVEEKNGAVHYDSHKTEPTTQKQSIWKQGDRKDSRLKDLFQHHKNDANPTE